MGGVTITELIDKMGLRNMTPELETDNVMLVHADVNRPALQLSGYFEHFEQSRVQIIGTVEYPIPLSAPGNRSIKPHRK